MLDIPTAQDVEIVEHRNRVHQEVLELSSTYRLQVTLSLRMLSSIILFRTVR